MATGRDRWDGRDVEKRWLPSSAATAVVSNSDLMTMHQQAVGRLHLRSTCVVLCRVARRGFVPIADRKDGIWNGNWHNREYRNLLSDRSGKADATSISW